MPTALFRGELVHPLDIDYLLTLATNFKVSLQAAAVRCTDFLRIGALNADHCGLLWRVGEVRRLDPLLEDRVASVIREQQQIRERVTLRSEDWILEGRPLPLQPDNALLLLQPLSAS